MTSDPGVWGAVAVISASLFGFLGIIAKGVFKTLDTSARMESRLARVERQQNDHLRWHMETEKGKRRERY